MRPEHLRPPLPDQIGPTAQHDPAVRPCA
jgi:hypothetical protein